MLHDPLPSDTTERTVYAWYHQDTGGWLYTHLTEGAPDSAYWPATTVPPTAALYATAEDAEDNFPTTSVYVADDPANPTDRHLRRVAGPAVDLDRADFGLARITIDVTVAREEHWCSPANRAGPTVRAVDVGFAASWNCCGLTADVPQELTPTGWRALHDTLRDHTQETTS